MGLLKTNQNSVFLHFLYSLFRILQLLFLKLKLKLTGMFIEFSRFYLALHPFIYRSHRLDSLLFFSNHYFFIAFLPLIPPVPGGEKSLFDLQINFD